MTLYQFNTLDGMEQAEVLWDIGVHIGERRDEEHKILLYQIDSFYVEVFYHQQYNVIRKIESFSSVEQLALYIEKMTFDVIKPNQK